MSKFNKKMPTSKMVNLAGGFAYSMKAEDELLHAVLTTFLEDKFYENATMRSDRIKMLVAQCSPIYVAQLAIVARNEFNLRSVTTFLLGELSRIHRGDDLLMRAIQKCAIRPDDLTELVSLIGTPLPKQVKRGVRHALLAFNRYQLAKYREEGKKVSLVDLFNLTHPNPKFANAEQKKAWKDLMKGNLISTDTWESEISTTKNKKKSWENLVLENKLGYMALLRNLNNLLKEDVSQKTLEKAIQKLTDYQEVKNSKQLPFRFMTAYKNVLGNSKLTNAISTAMDIAVDNVPQLKGKTLIAIDTSGSMSGDPIEKAAVFAAAIIKSNEDADIVLYSDVLKSFPVPTKSPVLMIAEKIIREAIGGGTNTGLVFRIQKKYDRIIILSDNESWQTNTQLVYRDYVTSMKANPYVYAIDIQGYGSVDIKGERVFHLTGWSDRLLDYLGKVEEGDTLLKHVKSIEV